MIHVQKCWTGSLLLLKIWYREQQQFKQKKQYMFYVGVHPIPPNRAQFLYRSLERRLLQTLHTPEALYQKQKQHIPSYEGLKHRHAMGIDYQQGGHPARSVAPTTIYRASNGLMIEEASTIMLTAHWGWHQSGHMGWRRSISSLLSSVAPFSLVPLADSKPTLLQIHILTGQRMHARSPSDPQRHILKSRWSSVLVLQLSDGLNSVSLKPPCWRLEELTSVLVSEQKEVLVSRAKAWHWYCLIFVFVV
jgi:hypothetical protein